MHFVQLHPQPSPAYTPSPVLVIGAQTNVLRSCTFAHEPKVYRADKAGRLSYLAWNMMSSWVLLGRKETKIRARFSYISSFEGVALHI